MQREIKLNVNGRIELLSVNPEAPLLYVLRNDLGLKAAKAACGSEQCGACKVLIDGIATSTCRLPVRSVLEKEIITLEGLGKPGNLHPIQQAFIETQAVQCGYCVPGMIITTKALLDRYPKPTNDIIKSELSGNVCRCAVYDRMKRAINYVNSTTPVNRSWQITPDQNPRTGEEYTDSLAGTLSHSPDIDSWIRINSDETITVFTGKVELGQHIKTAVAMIAAEELCVPLEKIQIVSGDTDKTPNEWYTAGSMSMEQSGTAIRNAAAEARDFLMKLGAEKLQVEAETLTIADGIIRADTLDKSVSYWALFADQKFNKRVEGEGKLKSPDQYQILGTPEYREDLVAKVTGEPCFVHDLDFPDMLHARVIRPPSYQANLIAVDETAVTGVSGFIKLIRNGNFLAVVTEREEQAIEAANLLRKATEWTKGADLPPFSSLYDLMRRQSKEEYPIVDGMTVQDPPKPKQELPNAIETISASYYRPYQAHASLGPSAAVARLSGGQLTICSHSQGPFLLKGALAHALSMDANDIRVMHTDGPGCYGHNGADDVAMDAALVALELEGRPVSMKWTKIDEMGWEPFGPSMIMDASVSLDENGKILNWDYDVWSSEASGRPRPDPKGGSGLLASWHVERPFKPLSRPGTGGPQLGSSRNSDPLYTIPNKRIVNHVIPNSPLRVSALRGLGAYANVFAIESFIDELANATDTDPIEFRLRHLDDERAIAVIESVRELSGWASWKEFKKPGTGKGIGFLRYKNTASYVAVVVDINIEPKSGLVQVLKGYIACDAGQIVNPDGIANQLEGSFIQSCSWTMREQVTFDEEGVTSLDLNSYPIFRFRDAPEVEISLLNRSGQPYLGVGEGAMGPIPAAIANAVHDAIGIRLREIPFVPEKVKTALRDNR